MCVIGSHVCRFFQGPECILLKVFHVLSGLMVYWWRHSLAAQEVASLTSGHFTARTSCSHACAFNLLYLWETPELVLVSFRFHSLCYCLKKVKFSHTRYWALGPELKVQPVSQVTLSHPPGGRLPLLSASRY